jgi:3-hydroxybutyryl-CoA dehydrogenase
MQANLNRILVVGAGWIGKQVAAQCLAHGLEVFVTDAQTQIFDEARHWITDHIAKQVADQRWSQSAITASRTKLTFISRELFTTTPVDLAIECVSESSSAKRKVLKELSQAYAPPTIIVSNSSYFTPSMLSKYVAHPERFAHLHFHAPIWLATVVDLVPGPEASPSVAEQLRRFAESIGQTPIVQTVEHPGYIFNAILQSVVTSSLDLVQRGVASPGDIDFSWTKVTGMKIGPFGMMDLIGLDVVQQVLINGRWQGDYEQRQAMIDFLEPLVSTQQLGVKTGKGFFEYPNESESSRG